MAYGWQQYQQLVASLAKLNTLLADTDHEYQLACQQALKPIQALYEPKLQLIRAEMKVAENRIASLEAASPEQMAHWHDTQMDTRRETVERMKAAFEKQRKAREKYNDG